MSWRITTKIYVHFSFHVMLEEAAARILWTE